jgi:hypothetical protein
MSSNTLLKIVGIGRFVMPVETGIQECLIGMNREFSTPASAGVTSERLHLSRRGLRVAVTNACLIAASPETPYPSRRIEPLHLRRRI